MKISTVLDRLGGTKAVARELGLTASAVRSWVWNGQIPRHWITDLYRMVSARGLAIHRKDLEEAD